MSFAILRLQKLKTFADVGGSLSHNYRNRETLNADDARTHLNEHELDTNEKCMTAIRDRIPEKRRKDAVLCIEHLITASPEWDGWGTEKETEFFEKSKKWLEEKYGKNNVISTTIHRDETTPHLVAYVVPVDEATGRLNAKKFIGGSRLTLSKMQTDFAVEVKHLGLDRGIEGSKAKHTSIKEYYDQVNEYDKTHDLNLSSPDLPEPDFFESKEKYGQRVAQCVLDSVFEQIRPTYEEYRVQAAQTKSSRKKANDAQKELKQIQEKAKPYLEAIKDYSPNLIKIFDEQILKIKDNIDVQLASHIRNKEIEQERRKILAEQREQDRINALEEQNRRTYELHRAEIELNQRKKNIKTDEYGNEYEIEP
jgi:hypothetical protein